MLARWMVTVAAASFAVAMGCGSNVAIDDDDGVGASGGAGAGGGNGNGGNGGSGAKGGECSAFHDQESPDTVTVRIVNETGVAIYLPAYCDRLAYDIAPTNGPADLSYVFDTSCTYLCELAQTEPSFGCPAAACAATSYEVPAGGTLEVVWPGTALSHGIDMPDACYLNPLETAACDQILVAPAGDYRAFVQGYMQCESDAQGPCDCDDDGGLCFGWPTGLEGFAEPAEFSFPAEGEVEIVFGPCAFGCAG